jgi:predicted amidohydrolase YtcJ
MTLGIAYNLFTQRPKQEKDDFVRWAKMTSPGAGDDFLRMNGAGETLVFSAADFEDFLEPRPDLPQGMEGELKEVVRVLAQNRWPFRLHATYDQSIARFLDVFEEVDREVPLKGLGWFFDHAETVSDHSLERIRELGGGIAVQHRMAFQGDYFVHRYGARAAERTPPVTQMLKMGIPVGAGTDATRVASYNPWVSLYWLVSGRTLGGLQLYPEGNRLSRMEALRLYTVGSSWFSAELGKKGAIVPGQLADLTVLSEDYFSIPEERIQRLESVLTVLGGEIVHGTGPFAPLAPPALPVLPEWSPAAKFGGYGAPLLGRSASAYHRHVAGSTCDAFTADRRGLWGSGCDCFAF